MIFVVNNYCLFLLPVFTGFFGFGGVLSIFSKTWSRFLSSDLFVMSQPLKSTLEYYQNHITKVGEITWAWNELHGWYLLMFLALLDKDDDLIGTSIWNSLKADSAQRGILLGLLKYKLKDVDLLKEVKWCLDRTNDINPYRNALVHVQMLPSMDDEGLKAHFYGPYEPSRKIEVLNDLSVYQKLMQDIAELSIYALHLYQRISGAEHLSLQDRPVLQGLEHCQNLLGRNVPNGD